MHSASSFVTLTYADEFLPKGGSLCPKDGQLFLKRLRNLLGPSSLRYFLVGEYGDRTLRPHYHAMLFGVASAELIGRAWKVRGKPIGLVDVGSVTPESAGYITGYVVKKLTGKDDPRLEGRHPEFARMSLKPGIGAPAMVKFGEYFVSGQGSKVLARDGDVVQSFKIGARNYPLGRYLRDKLREETGLSKGTPQRVLDQLEVAGYEALKSKEERELRRGKRVQSAEKARFLKSLKSTIRRI